MHPLYVLPALLQCVRGVSEVMEAAHAGPSEPVKRARETVALGACTITHLLVAVVHLAEVAAVVPGLPEHLWEDLPFRGRETGMCRTSVRPSAADTRRR